MKQTFTIVIVITSLLLTSLPRNSTMHNINPPPTNNIMNNTMNPGQLIKFPTITKLTYDGDNSQTSKNSFNFKSTSTRLIFKNPTPLGAMTQTNSFRVVEVPPDDHVMKICMMNINQHKYQTAPKDTQQEKQNVTRRSIAMALLRKQKSSSLLTTFNPMSRKDSFVTINRTSQGKTSSVEQQGRNRSKTQSLLKFKPNHKPTQSKTNPNQIYTQIMIALALVNGGIVVNQGKSFQRIRRAKIEKGNNGYLVKQMIKKRNWWNTTEEAEDSNMIWTQKIVKEAKISEQFYSQIVQQDQNCVVFQRNIDQVLFFYPKMLQLFFTDEQITKITIPQQNQSFKAKKASPIYNLLSNKKATRKIMPELTILYNHIPNNFQISSKKMLYKNLWRYYHETGMNPYRYIPKTYHLTAFDWQEKIGFIRDEQKKTSIKGQKNEPKTQAWFLKPGQNTNRGKGIQMFKSTPQVLDHIVRNPPKSITKTYILQEYINPLLYNNRKFDIRCYILCIQAFNQQTYYWYEEGYIRTSSFKFTMSKTSISIHLTNDAVQKEFDNYDKYESANKLSYFQIDKYIKTEYGYEFLGAIVPRMKGIAADVCKSAVQMGKVINKGSDQQGDKVEVKQQKTGEYPGLYFQIFGLDFILSKDGDPYLLEANTNPCLQISSNLLSRIIPELIQNTFRIVTDVYMPNKTTTDNRACPDWAQSFLVGNKFSLIHKREIS